MVDNYSRQSFPYGLLEIAFFSIVLVIEDQSQCSVKDANCILNDDPSSEQQIQGSHRKLSLSSPHYLASVVLFLELDSIQWSCFCLNIGILFIIDFF